MIDVLVAIGHWCASCIPPGVGVAPTLGALSGAAAAAAGISGLGDLASDGGVGDVSGAPAGASAGADAPASAASDAGTGPGSAAGTGPEAGSGSESGNSTATESPPGDSPASPTEAQATPSAEPTPGPFTSPGWIDNALGLNPNTSFVQGGMEALGYGQTGIWGRPIAPSDGDLTTLGRALGAAGVSPLAVYAAAGGDLLDTLNHGFELAQVGKEVGEQLNEAPTNSPPPAPSDPQPSDPQPSEPQPEPQAEAQAKPPGDSP